MKVGKRRTDIRRALPVSKVVRRTRVVERDRYHNAVFSKGVDDGLHVAVFTGREGFVCVGDVFVVYLQSPPTPSSARASEAKEEGKGRR